MNNPNIWLDFLGITLTFIAFSFVWRFLKYEFTLHCGRKYLVEINFKCRLDTSTKEVARYAISAFTEDDAIIKALKKWSSTGFDGKMQYVVSCQAIKID